MWVTSSEISAAQGWAAGEAAAPSLLRNCQTFPQQRRHSDLQILIQSQSNNQQESKIYTERTKELEQPNDMRKKKAGTLRT